MLLSNIAEEPTVPALEIEPGAVLVAYRGSLAHGLYVAKHDPNHIDDIDIMGFVIAPLDNYFGLKEWGSRGTKEYWRDCYDCVYYDLARKAFPLLLQGNPNILSTLWVRPSEIIETSAAGHELLANRELFVGKHVYDSFAGYAHAQLLKMTSREPAEIRQYLGVTYELKKRSKHPTDQVLPDDLGDYTDCSAWSDEKLIAANRSFQKKGENLGYLGDKRKKLVLEHGFDRKNGAHCIRLLKMAKEFLLTGGMNVYRTDDAQELLDIKSGRDGKWPLEQVKELAEQLFAEIKVARDHSPLPKEPDREGANKLLVRLMRQHFSMLPSP
jgi:hypothetical protein